jgi:DNA-binding NarL/FixJ family response regulator
MNDTFFRATQALNKLPEIFSNGSTKRIPRKLTDKEIDRICELYTLGWSKPDIALEMNMHQSTVYNAVRRFLRSESN